VASAPKTSGVCGQSRRVAPLPARAVEPRTRLTTAAPTLNAATATSAETVGIARLNATSIGMPVSFTSTATRYCP
jgi:hypothetical protein